MKDRFCELCEKTANYVIGFRRKGAQRESMIALIQYICVQLTGNTEENCWGHTQINIVITPACNLDVVKIKCS